MAQRVASVEPIHETSEFGKAGGGEAESPREAARFVYASGSRPLDGYTLKRGVGQGGFGEIYYAVNDAGKEVALKLIRRNLDIELRGIRHCLNLKHPHLVDLYDIRTDAQGDTWVVMEYVAGESLEDTIAANPKGMSPAMALGWFAGIAAAVAYLHDRGIVHRDLKPGNIFSAEGLVKVGDYGLSKFISCSRRSGHTESIGTVHYMAPEVANGRYGREIDIYALGVVLYEMLTGRVPFEGESIGEVLMKHLTAKPDLSGVAEPYRAVVGRALEKDPALRWQTVGEMLAALPMHLAAPAYGQIPAAAFTPVGASARTPHAKPILAEVVPEEPIWRALCQGWQSLKLAWNGSNMHTLVKVGLLIGVLFVLLHSAALAIPLLVMLTIVYGIYRLIWELTQGSQRTAPPQAAPGPTLVRAEVVSQRSPNPQEQAAAELRAKPPARRVLEVLGSMLSGAFVAMVTAMAAVLLVSFDSQMPRPEQGAWLMLIGLAGSWAVMAASKAWEGKEGEAVLRRFVMLVLGLVLGAAAYGTVRMLLVSLPAEEGFPEPGYALPAFFSGDGSPTLKAFLASFGTLFLLIGWWKQADPLRPTRLSLWTLLVTVVVAGFVAAAWHFPQPWLPLAAGVISVTVQLASPWVNLHERG